MNRGPSFDTQQHAFQKLNGFYQRFNLRQDDNRMTPGKRQPKLPEETIRLHIVVFRPDGWSRNVAGSLHILVVRPRRVVSQRRGTKHESLRQFWQCDEKL